MCVLELLANNQFYCFQKSAQGERFVADGLFPWLGARYLDVLEAKGTMLMRAHYCYGEYLTSGQGCGKLPPLTFPPMQKYGLNTEDSIGSSRRSKIQSRQLTE